MTDLFGGAIDSGHHMVEQASGPLAARLGDFLTVPLAAD
jgi:hypothetical protein